MEMLILIISFHSNRDFDEASQWFIKKDNYIIFEKDKT